MAAHLEHVETWTCSHCEATATVETWSCGCVKLKWRTRNVKQCQRCDQAPRERHGRDYPRCKRDDY